ncbi:MAG: hypothetical protein LBU85_00205 [Treponema sp.]|jgi:hypothetical protein|nr:hypothetical protein [Treponema sp.]
MKDNRCDSLQLLALVPHRDIRGTLRVWSHSLFSAGLCGAWSFPWVMPLAALNRPLSGGELKSRALMLRRAMENSGGKITTDQPAIAALFDNVFVFGPAVNIGFQDSFFAFEDNAVLRRISPPVIGCSLCQDALPPPAGCPAPCLSFRAAALANMTFRPLPLPDGSRNGLSFEWEIGKLYWLPHNERRMKRER